MSFYALATGSLIGEPVRRTGAKGDFGTATIRVPTDDGAILVSAIAFGDLAGQLLTHRRGAAVAISGRARLSSWTSREGVEHHGLSLVVEQIISVATGRQMDTKRRREARAA